MTTTRALVDSGADFTTFSSDWAEMLGISLKNDCIEETVGVADGRPSKRYVFQKGLLIEVVGERILLPIARFCVNLPIAYLGRRDFFSRYLVLLDQQNFQFFLERRVDPEAEGDDNSELDAAVVAR
ncbi:MAG TPA: aspartyl protease family protein [Solirubrobacteraceae bacterium]|nr:aspartyl protease family protein [Solirubrobacteraceae bacterium]